MASVTHILPITQFIQSSGKSETYESSLMIDQPEGMGMGAKVQALMKVLVMDPAEQNRFNNPSQPGERNKVGNAHVAKVEKAIRTYARETSTQPIRMSDWFVVIKQVEYIKDDLIPGRYWVNN